MVFCMLLVLLTHITGACEPRKQSDKAIQELAGKYFLYSNIDGRQSLTLTTKEVADRHAEDVTGPCDNNVAVLAHPCAGISVPGTSLILAFLDCPVGLGFQNESVMAFFDRKDTSVPLCFSRLDLMPGDTGVEYYYGTIESLGVRKAGKRALHVVVTLGGADGGDCWTSFALLHIDMNCKITLLSRLYAGYYCNDGCEGSEIAYHFVDDNTVEVTEREFDATREKIDKVKNTTRTTYHLKDLYNNPRSRVFPSETERDTAFLNSVVDVNAKDAHGMTPLMWAAELDSQRLVNDLVGKGAEIDANDDRGQTPLMVAAHGGHLGVVTLLMEKGANIRAKDRKGRTVLMYAASGEDVRVTCAEVQAGKAALECWDSGSTLDVIRLLIERGLDVNAKAENGYTPLMTAASVGIPAVVTLLIEKGADVNAKTKNGSTALTVASRRGHERIVELLKEHGAKE